MRDQFRHENMTPEIMERATQVASAYGLNPEYILSTPERFNEVPIELRSQFFNQVKSPSKSVALNPFEKVLQERIDAAPKGERFDANTILTKRIEDIETAKKEAVTKETTLQQAAIPQLDAAGRVVRDQPKARETRKVKDFMTTVKEGLVGGGEALLTIGSGGVMAPIAAVEQLGSDILAKAGGKKPTGTDVFAKRMEATTYKPRSETGKEIVETLGETFSGLPPVMTPELMALGQTKVGAIPRVSTTKPRYTLAEAQETQAIIKGTSPVAQRYEQLFGGTGMKSAGAAARGDAARVEAAIDSLPIEYQSTAREQVKRAGGAKKANVVALENEAEALNLPVPIRLLPGQATDDVIIKAYEYNNRARLPKVQERFVNQPLELVENLDAIQNLAAPNVFDRKPASLGQSLRTKYEKIDDDLNAEINEKYNQVVTSAGGSFPIDTKQLYGNIKKVLDDELVFDDAPKTQIKNIKSFAQSGSMTIQQFLASRRNLSRISADRNIDGETRFAARKMVEELDKLPMSFANAETTRLAAEARAAAKARFDMLDDKKPQFDPVYKAVLGQKVANEYLISDFVVGKKGSEATLRQVLNNTGSEGREILAAAFMEEIKKRAVSKTADNKAEFKAVSYKKALDLFEPELRETLGNDLFNKMTSIANVSSRTIAREKAGVYGLSGTLPGGILQGAASKAAGTAEQTANLAALKAGIPVNVGTKARVFFKERATKKQDEELSQPFSGVKPVKLRDIGK